MDSSPDRIVGGINLIVSALTRHGHQSDVGKKSDFSEDILIHLALAFDALTRLEKAYGPVEFNNRALIRPAILQAFREALHVRKDLPSEAFQDTVSEWPIALTRFGNVR